MLDAIKSSADSIQQLNAQNELIFTALYELAHDVDRAPPFGANRTVEAFGHQWANLPTGKYMLNDPDFRAAVADIICDEEILLRHDWFKGKKVVDAGCGGGRWAYGLSKLGAQVTAVDANLSALEATKKALANDPHASFVHTRLEEVSDHLTNEAFDLVWSWGVAHHCTSFSEVIDSFAKLLKPGGILFVYLYGRESIPLGADVDLFKERLLYNYLPDQPARTAFLEQKAAVTGVDVHHQHDIYAPLINRRFDYDEIVRIPEPRGFANIERVKEHGEIWVQATLGEDDAVLLEYGNPQPTAPYWFQR